jgi:hypothetical protein
VLHSKDSPLAGVGFLLSFSPFVSTVNSLYPFADSFAAALPNEQNTYHIVVD